ncbi:MAG: PQQ-binding-like beta-propeller repeat protein [Armatimonadetes bacterium]|nr:PQQ-binding-like beta-propeller repeat protein [Armatimonadota bacterium]
MAILASSIRFAVIVLLAALTISGCRPKAATQDWPMAGQNPGQTYFSGEAVQSPLSLQWVRRFPGKRTPYLYVSEPVASRDSVFLAVSGCIFALDASSGQDRWSLCMSPDPSAVKAPVVSGTRLLGLIHGSTLFALDAQKGETLWQTGLSGSSGTTFDPGLGEPNLLADSRAVYLPDGAYSLEDGKAIWQRNDLPFPLGRSAADERNLYVSTSKGLFVLEKATGKTVWTFPDVRSPAVFGSRILCISDSPPGLTMLSTNGRKEREIPISGISAFSGEENIAFASTPSGLVQIDLSSGSTKPASAQFASSAPLTGTPGFLLVGAGDRESPGNLALLDRRSLAPSWSSALESPVTRAISTSNHRVVVATSAGYARSFTWGQPSLSPPGVTLDVYNKQVESLADKVRLVLQKYIASRKLKLSHEERVRSSSALSREMEKTFHTAFGLPLPPPDRIALDWQVMQWVSSLRLDIEFDSEREERAFFDKVAKEGKKLEELLSTLNQKPRALRAVNRQVRLLVYGKLPSYF